jgi:hypothetical protein
MRNLNNFNINFFLSLHNADFRLADFIVTLFQFTIVNFTTFSISPQHAGILIAL